LPQAANPPGAILRKVNFNGTLGYRGYQIQVGSIWDGHRLRITEMDGVVQCFYGEQLVRALVIDPNRQFQPLGFRPVTKGWPRPKTAKNP